MCVDSDDPSLHYVSYYEMHKHLPHINMYKLHNIEQCHIFINLMNQEVCGSHFNFKHALSLASDCIDPNSMIGLDIKVLLKIVNNNQHHNLDSQLKLQIISMVTKYYNIFFDLYIFDLGTRLVHFKGVDTTSTKKLSQICKKYNLSYHFVIYQRCLTNHFGNREVVLNQKDMQNVTNMLYIFTHTLEVKHNLVTALATASKHCHGKLSSHINTLAKCLDNDNLNKYHQEIFSFIGKSKFPLLKSFYRLIYDTLHINGLPQRHQLEVLTDQAKAYTILNDIKSRYIKYFRNNY